MRVALGSDHGGFELKQEIIKYLEEKNIEYKDYGCYSTESTDYPIYAKKVAHGILDGECELRNPCMRNWYWYFYHCKQN